MRLPLLKRSSRNQLLFERKLLIVKFPFFPLPRLNVSLLRQHLQCNVSLDIVGHAFKDIIPVFTELPADEAERETTVSEVDFRLARHARIAFPSFRGIFLSTAVVPGEILVLWKSLRASRKILFQVFFLPLSDSLHHFCEERGFFFSSSLEIS